MTALNGYLLTISNVGTMNTYSVTSYGEKENDEYVQNCVLHTSIATFVHQDIVLSVFVILAMYEPTFFSDLAFPDFQLKSSHLHLFTAFGFVFLMGVYSLTVILCRAKNIAKVEVQNKVIDNEAAEMKAE